MKTFHKISRVLLIMQNIDVEAQRQALATAEHLKNEGSEFLRLGESKQALRKYHMVRCFLLLCIPHSTCMYSLLLL